MFNLYPYTDFHDMNLDWIIRKIIELGHAFNDFEAVNKITNAGAWDITKQYQAWTIVSDNNMGYISLKPVPVGVAITNTEYWGLVADYDILITNLSARISALEDEMEQMTTKRYIFMSDSYGYSPAPTTSWIADCVDTLGLSASDYFSWYEGGTGFIHQGNMGHTFKTLAESHEAGVTDKDMISDVILCAGTNDIAYAGDYLLSDLIPEITDFCEYISATYPNAKIHIGMCGNLLGKTATQYEASCQMPWIYQTGALNAKNTCYIDNIEYIMHIYSNMDDTMHPTVNGAKEIARCVLSHLNGGSYVVISSESQIFSAYGANTVSSGNTCKLYTENGLTHFKFNASSFTLATPGSALEDYPLMRYNPKKLGCLDKDRAAITGVLLQNFNTPVPCRITFDVDDPTSNTGGIVMITTNNSGINITNGAMPYVDATVPTILL